ncbi:MAG TPA: GAF domain-containing protein [Anaerolineales bacterium]|nr:GAF domain-containing protein [Anaerolineales bacterium]
MRRQSQLLGNETQKYALVGILFGFLFPIIATTIRIIDARLPFSLSSIMAVQASDSLLWIIDTAPLFLGLFAAFAGRRQDRLQKLNSELISRENELRMIQATLERRVEQRTQELSIVNQKTERRVEQLQTIAEIARKAISIRNMSQLMPSLAQLISEQFGFYHVGLYLIDELNQYAILRASNSGGGTRMLHHGYRLKVGEKNIVGYVARHGQAHIASDSGDEMFLAEADLPETKSEMVLPLKSAAQIIGVVDIRSIEVNAFSPDDINTLSILADQIAITIQNTILYEKSEHALREAEIASSQASGQAWKGYTESIQTKGYRYNGIRPEPLRESLGSSSENGTLLHPVRLRGEIIGRLELKASNASRRWTEDELAILEATAERVAIALEGARLLEDAQKRATREAFLSDVAAKLGTSFKLDSILRDTVEELGQTLKGSTVSFQLVDPLARSSTEVSNSNGNSESEMKSE